MGEIYLKGFTIFHSSRQGDFYVSLAATTAWGKRAYNLDQTLFEKELQRRGFEIISGGYKIKIAQKEVISSLQNSFVFHEAEGGLVRSINSCGATLIRESRLEFKEIDLIYTPTNLGSEEAQEGLIKICKEYVEIINLLLNNSQDCL